MKTLEEHKQHSFIAGVIVGFLVGCATVLVVVTLALIFK